MARRKRGNIFERVALRDAQRAVRKGLQITDRNRKALGVDDDVDSQQLRGAVFSTLRPRARRDILQSNDFDRRTLGERSSGMARPAPFERAFSDRGRPDFFEAMRERRRARLQRRRRRLNED